MRGNSLTIGFDVSRFADAKIRGWYYTGITRYTENIYFYLQRFAPWIKVKPVLFHNIEHNLYSGAVINEVQQLIKKEITILGREENHDCTRWNIYHSAVNPLPARNHTGTAVRVLTIHDCLHLKYPEMYPKGEPPIRKALESINTSQDYVICVSKSTQQDVLSYVPINESHTCVIPNAASPLFLRPKQKKALELLTSIGAEPGKYILALAQAEIRKNVLRLVEAFVRMSRRRNGDDYLLILVAHPAKKEYLLKQLHDEGLSLALCKIVTDVDDETLSGLYANAALFAYVPLYEGFGIPVLEAMSAGCPVLVSNTSSMPEIAYDAAYYVNPLDIESISNGIELLLNNEPLREFFIMKGNERCTHFSWEKTTRMTLQFYLQALQQHRTLTSFKNK